MSPQTLAPAKKSLRSVASKPQKQKTLACVHVTSRFTTFYGENSDQQLCYLHSRPMDENLLPPVRDLKNSHPPVMKALLYGMHAYDLQFFNSLPLMMQYEIKVRYIKAREILQNLKRSHLIKWVDAYLMFLAYHTVKEDSPLITITDRMHASDLAASRFNYRQLGITEKMLVRIFTKNKLFLHHPAIAGGKLQ
jgi:hypothetical protein